MLALAPFARAQQATESAIKAAFLFKFASFVEWPGTSFADAAAPFVIGVMGSEEIAVDLELVTGGRLVNGHPVRVRRVADADALRGLHLLFVSRRESQRIPAVVKAARPLSILVVTEAERGLESGGVINFVVLDDRVGFEVSLEAAERSGLKISSRMLGVARRVVGIS